MFKKLLLRACLSHTSPPFLKKKIFCSLKTTAKGNKWKTCRMSYDYKSHFQEKVQYNNTCALRQINCISTDVVPDQRVLSMQS